MDLCLFISKRAIPWLATARKSAPFTAPPAHWRRIHGHKWQARAVCHCSPLPIGEGGQQWRMWGSAPPEGLLSHSWLVRSAAACVFQPAGARLIHLIKTDLMIETETLFITLDFHTRHDSRLFHLRAFICRNEECVPIFKLNLPPPPFFPFVKMVWHVSFLSF